MEIVQSIIMGAGSMICAFLFIPYFIAYLKRNGQVDNPNHRSAHTDPTPTMGGVAFFIPLLSVPVVAFNNETLCAICFIAFCGGVGYYDDRTNMRPARKLIVLTIAGIGIYFSDFSINPMFFFLFGTELPEWLNAICTVIFVVSVINAFNLIDGIDGLLGLSVFLISLLFATCFLVSGEWSYFLMALGVGTTMIAFLYFNFHSARIFMGDTGSLLLGAYVVVCLLKISAKGEPVSTLSSMSIIIYPCLDTLRLLIGRYLVTKSPFKADKNHFHHFLLRNGWSHQKSTVFIVAMQGLLIATAWLIATDQSNYLEVVCLISVGAMYYGVVKIFSLGKLQKRVHKAQQRLQHEKDKNYLLKAYIS